MERKTFLKSLAFLPLAGLAGSSNELMKINELVELGDQLGSTDKMPVLFVGHGNPMNAITTNVYSQNWAATSKRLPLPKAILCVSAHWLTKGTAVTLTPKPQTIHDFGGFPQELFNVQYPAPGAVDYAKMAKESLKGTAVHEDFEWGLDHGAWSVLMHMYPKADVPVFQLSIDYSQPPRYHYELAKHLSALRRKGVLIVASGNVVHNLGMMNWNNDGKKFDWAVEFDTMVKHSIENNNPEALIEYQKLGKLAQLAHPTNDHYLPLIYAVGLREKQDRFEFFNDSFDLGSISMRSVIFS